MLIMQNVNSDWDFFAKFRIYIFIECETNWKNRNLEKNNKFANLVKIWFYLD